MTALWIAIGVSALALGLLSSVFVYAGLIVESRQSPEREQQREDRAA